MSQAGRMGLSHQPSSTALELLLDGAPRGELRRVELGELLVEHGWLRLLCRVAGFAQQVAVLVSARTPRAVTRLTQLEYELLELGSRGLMVKQYAAELAVSEGCIRNASSRLLHKFGLDSGNQLPAIWHALRNPAAELALGADKSVLLFSRELLVGSAETELTSAEQEIAASILFGRSNRTIAMQRGTSERTIANQVSNIFRKLGVCSRRELSAKLLTQGESFPDGRSGLAERQGE